MDAGASVVSCSNFDAPYTFGSSISIRASRGSWVRSAGFGFVLIASEGAPNASEKASRWSAGRTTSENKRNALEGVGRAERLSLIVLVPFRMTLACALASRFCTASAKGVWRGNGQGLGDLLVHRVHPNFALRFWMD